MFGIKYGNSLRDLTGIVWPRRTVVVPCWSARGLLI